ncbi:uncharacterized protein TrAtP1_010301 [Trichoderma atroviride]|uniref:uncharacterized protein n=1 Tax=Hypocrea atroviridis TaxID=63577 RepID=UPI0033317BCA|nr:hypothetical protein TrAtP1_010301 [Trichoderma atroviride]
MAGNNHEKKTASKSGSAQASMSHQTRQWLSQPGGQDPWTPIRCTTCSNQHINHESGAKENKGGPSSDCATQGSIPESHEST